MHLQADVQHDIHKHLSGGNTYVYIYWFSVTYNHICCIVIKNFPRQTQSAKK